MKTQARILLPTLSAAALAAAPVALPRGELAAQGFDDVEFDILHVNGSVWMLNSGRGGNIGVSWGDDGFLIVDDQFAPLADKIRAALGEVAGTDSGSPEFILNTHWHGDHTGANAEFSDEATIIAHDNVRRRLSTEQTRGLTVTPPSPEEAWPVITFANAISVHFNGEEIIALHLPNGHTDGDAVIWFTGSNVIHMGDDYFADRFPFVDLESGGTVRGLERAIANVLAVAPAGVGIIPGHGPLSTVSDLERYQTMIQESIALMEERIADGMSEDDAKAAGVPAGADWSDWGEGQVFISTDRWLETLYRSLTGAGGEPGERVEHGHGNRR